MENRRNVRPRMQLSVAVNIKIVLFFVNNNNNDNKQAMTIRLLANRRFHNAIVVYTDRQLR